MTILGTASSAIDGDVSSMRLFDMHCHVDFAPNAASLAAGLDELGVSAFSATVTPEGYERAVQELAACGNVRVALGLHPWGVAEGESDGANRALERFEHLVGSTRFVGEIGLDFGARHGASREAQERAFDRVVSACANLGGKVLTLHAVRAAGAVLDALERHRATEGSACVFHWFSGSSDDLQRAIRLGCFFSVGPRMLATKRGRAYAQAVPRERLLLETDEPSAPGAALEAGAWRGLLERALVDLAGLRDESAADLGMRIAATSALLLEDDSRLEG